MRFAQRPAFWITAALVLQAGLLPEPARGDAQRVAPGAVRPRTRVALSTWNDHTTASFNAVALAWGERGLDGNDLGYTYGVGVSVERTFADGLTWTGVARSRLYLRRTGDPPAGAGSDRIPVWYIEEDEVLFSADTRARGLPWYWRLGGGLFVDNKDRNLFGSLRQQHEFHEFFRATGLKKYDYFDPGGDARGLSANAAVGAQVARDCGGGIRVSGAAELGAEPYTHWASSRIVQSLEGRVAIPLGGARLELALRNDTTLHAKGVAYQPELEFAVTVGRFSLASAVALPRGELRNSVRYNDDKDAIATLTLAVTLD